MKHYIIVKFAESVNTHDLLHPIEELFNKSLGIDGVHTVKIRGGNTSLPNRHDLMIEMELTPFALSAFDHSEIHKQWKDVYGGLITSKTIFDCD